MNKAENNINEIWVDNVNSLAEQVRILALNLAINLAREKKNIRELTFLEPDFTKLVYGSVEVIKEVSAMLKAFRNEEKMVYAPPTSSGKLDHVESSLNEILNLSRNILKVIARIKEDGGRVDNYNKPGTDQNQ
ncbi:MAG: hypothetical protein DRP51_10120 [Candidatus Zixiibacteriota bacterium]|nr:MAG: hypothetical protein DRP51_10120 [candidate division Zixibacteria bacterium]HHI03093.1 hypothetical protein [candidate division Zixibacteria bacterium]